MLFYIDEVNIYFNFTVDFIVSGRKAEGKGDNE
jgi:hypothetical protein